MPSRRPRSRRKGAPINRRSILLIAVLALLALGGMTLALRSRTEPVGGPTGLFTTLPILWSEAPDVASILKSDAPPHWARAVLADGGRLVALDVLAAPGGKSPLDDLHRLVMAQPRPLSPEENVALDEWVRGGGKVLLFADPALTEESNFAIGDPRRPQAVVLLSPILRRWGLEMRFAESQRFGEAMVDAGGTGVPVNLPGNLAVLPGSGCTLAGQGLIATCAIGRGQATVVADADVLASEDPAGTRAAALTSLLEKAFAPL